MSPEKDLPFFIMFEAASAHAAAFELRARLVADLSGATRHLSTTGTLEKILEALKTNHNKALAESEWSNLDLARKVRNKLYHGELDKAVELVGAPVGGVRSIEIPEGADGQIILDRINALAEGAGTPVAGTSTKDHGVFGWLLEAYKSGALEHMVVLFFQARKSCSKIADFINNRP